MYKRYVYLLGTDDNRYKIGVSVDVERRIKQLQTGCSDKIFLVDKFLSKFLISSIIYNFIFKLCCSSIR